MARTATERFQDHELSGSRQSYMLRVYIHADDGTLCDINKAVPAHVDDLFYHRLIELPSSIKTQSELSAGVFSTSASTLLLRDDDRTFQTALPWTLYATGSTTPHTLTAWYRATVTLKIAHRSDSATWQDISLGVFKIEELTPDADTRTVAMKLYGLERVLMDAKAKDCRDGDTWFENIPADLLVKELVARGGRGAVTLEAGSPSISALTLDEPVVAPVGNFPPKDDQGAWFRKKQIIPRYALRIGTTMVLWVGYHIQENKPAAVLWDSSTDSWASDFYDNAGLVGFEAVFVAPVSAGNYKVFCVSNRVGPTEAYPGLNHELRWCTYNTTSKMFSNLAPLSSVFINACGVQYESDHIDEIATGKSVRLWGDFNKTPNMGSYTSARCAMPHLTESGQIAFGYPYALRLVADTNTTTGQDEVRNKTDMGDGDLTSDTYIPAATIDVPRGAILGRAYFSSGSLGTSSMPARVWWHTSVHRSFQYNASKGKVYWMQYNASTREWVLASITLSTGTAAYQNIILPTVSWSTFSLTHGNAYWERAHVPTAFCVVYEGSGTAFIYIGSMAGNHVETLTGGDESAYPPPAVAIRRFVLPDSGNISSIDATLTFPVSTTVPGLGVSWTQRYFPAIISIDCSNQANGLPVWGQVLNLWAPSSAAAYGWWGFTSTGEYAQIYTSPTGQPAFPQSSMPFEISRERDGDFNWYAVDQGTGALYRVKLNTWVPVHTPLWMEPVSGDIGGSRWQSCNPVWLGSGTDMRLIGVTVGGPPADTMCGFHYDNSYGWDGESPPLGAYSPGGRSILWQYGYTIPAVIELASFADESVWDSLGMVVGVSGDYIMGHNSDGALYFKGRSTTGSWNLRRRTDSVSVHDITSPTIAAGKIASKLDFGSVVNSVKVPCFLPEIKAPQVSMILTEGSKAADLVPTVLQTSTTQQRLLLSCISGGRAIESGGDDSALLFAFTRTLDELTAHLSQSAPVSNSEFYVWGLYEDETGAARLGSALLRVGDMCRVGNGDQREIVAIDAATRMISVDDAIGPVGGSVHSAGAAVEIIPKDRVRYGSSADGICTLPSAAAVGGTSALSLTVDTTENLAPGMVIWAARDSRLCEVLDIVDETTVVVMPGALGTGATATGYVWPAGSRICGAIWPRYWNRSYAIGSTGVSVSLGQSGASGTLSAGAFSVGDQIRIQCFGLDLASMEYAVYRSESSESIDMYGVKEWKPSVENRLVTPLRARWMLEALAHRLEPTYYTVASDCDFLPTVAAGQQVRVYDGYYFGTDPVIHRVVGIDWNPKAGTMSLYMRSVAQSQRGPAGIPGPGRGSIRGDRDTRGRGR